MSGCNLPVFVCLLNKGVITIDNGLLDFYANKNKIFSYKNIILIFLFFLC